MLRQKTLFKPVIFRYKLTSTQAIKLIYKARALSKYLHKSYSEDEVQITYSYKESKIIGITITCTNKECLNHIEMKYFIRKLQKRSDKILYWSKIYAWRKPQYIFAMTWR